MGGTEKSCDNVTFINIHGGVMEHFCTRGMDVVLYSTHFLYSSDIAVVSNSPGHTLAQCCFLSRTDLCSARFLVLHRWGAGPWRSPPTWTCCPGPEHISPAEAEKMKTFFFPYKAWVDGDAWNWISYIFSWQWFQLSVGCSQFGVLQLVPQGLDGSERRVDLHGSTGLVCLMGKKKKVLTLKWQ